MNYKKPLTHQEKIGVMVQEMMLEKNNNPHDKAFRFIQEYHPEEQHISLRYPGKFIKPLSTETFT